MTVYTAPDAPAPTTTESWADLPLRWVPLDRVEVGPDVSLLDVLHAMQGRDPWPGGEHPFLVLDRDGTYRIHDGAHLVAKAILSGRDCLRARVHQP